MKEITRNGRGGGQFCNLDETIFPLKKRLGAQFPSLPRNPPLLEEDVRGLPHWMFRRSGEATMFSVEYLKEGQPPPIIEYGPFRSLHKARDAARRLYYAQPGLVGYDKIHIVEDGEVIDEVIALRY